MPGPTQKSTPTVADYKAAEARMREARDKAAAGMKASEDKGDAAAGDEWASRLKNEFDNFKAFREKLPRNVILSIHADRILESFSIEEERGWKAKIESLFGRATLRTVSLVIPSEVSDEDAMHALNARFRKMFPKKNRAAICEPHIENILDAGNGSGRRSGGPRIIRLIGVVPGTTNMVRDLQAEALHEKGLTFPHPIEQALAAAAYACKRSGEDLFKDLGVRGSVPGFALRTPQHLGVLLYECGDVPDDGSVAASGSLSPELKNLDR